MRAGEGEGEEGGLVEDGGVEVSVVVVSCSVSVVAVAVRQDKQLVADVERRWLARVRSRRSGGRSCCGCRRLRLRLRVRQDVRLEVRGLRELLGTTVEGTDVGTVS